MKERRYFYLDDQRPNPDPSCWTLITTAAELITLLEKELPDLSHVSLSLDHDLGNAEGDTGYHVCLALEEWSLTIPDFKMPEKIQIHSSNPVGRLKMQACLDAIKRNQA